MTTVYVSLLMHVHVFVFVCVVLCVECRQWMNKQRSADTLVYTVFIVTHSLVSKPLWRGGERPGMDYMHMAVTIQVLNNPITYRYFVVYLPFDLK